jgi:hypothetical protein
MEQSKERWHIVSRSGEIILTAERWVDLVAAISLIGDKVSPEGIAQAKPICAAPDLLEALVNLVSEIPERALDAKFQSLVYNAKQAIKKAIE